MRKVASLFETPQQNSSVIVLRNTVWVFLNEGVLRGTTLLTSVYFARELGASRFGVLSLAQSIVLFFWLFCDSGTSLYGTREIAAGQSRQTGLVSNILLIQLILGVVFACIATSGLAIYRQSPDLHLAWPALGFLLFYAFFCDWVLKGIQRFQDLPRATVPLAIFQIGLAFLFVHGPADLTFAAAVLPLSYLLGGVLITHLVHKQGFHPLGFFSVTAASIRHHYRAASGFFLGGISSSLYSALPLLLYGARGTSANLGLLAASLRLINPLGAIGFFLTVASFPQLVKGYAANREDFQKIRSWLRFGLPGIGAVIAIGLFIVRSQLFPLIFTHEYIQAIPVFSILLLLIPLNFLRYAYTSILNATGKERQQIAPFLSGVVILVSGGLLLGSPQSPEQFADIMLMAELVLILLLGRKANAPAI